MSEKFCPFTNRECRSSCALYICNRRIGCSITITAQILISQEQAQNIKDK